MSTVVLLTLALRRNNHHHTRATAIEWGSIAATNDLGGESDAIDDASGNRLQQRTALFEPSLEVLATVISAPPRSRWGGRRVVCDAGSKAIDLVGGNPWLRGGIFRSGGDEHGILELYASLPAGCGDTTYGLFPYNP